MIGVARDPIDLLALAQDVFVDGALGGVLVAVPAHVAPPAKSSATTSAMATMRGLVTQTSR